MCSKKELVVLRRPARRLKVACLGSALVIAAMALAGCESGTKSADSAAAGRGDDPLAGIFGPAPEKSGTQLWAENCSRCHNSRPANSYSGAQWTLLMHHMRSRADLTGQEERKILTFLQAGAGAD